jgi:hypothetical protein
MNRKQEYTRAFEIVRGVVHAWDPYGLIAHGAPRDEFDREVACVVAQIPRIGSAFDAALALSRVFSSSFESERFEPEHCRDAGDRLFECLRQEGFVR